MGVPGRFTLPQCTRLPCLVGAVELGLAPVLLNATLWAFSEAGHKHHSPWHVGGVVGAKLQGPFGYEKSFLEVRADRHSSGSEIGLANRKSRQSFHPQGFEFASELRPELDDMSGPVGPRRTHFRQISPKASGLKPPRTGAGQAYPEGFQISTQIS